MVLQCAFRSHKAREQVITHPSTHLLIHPPTRFPTPWTERSQMAGKKLIHEQEEQKKQVGSVAAGVAALANAMHSVLMPCVSHTEATRQSGSQNPEHFPREKSSEGLCRSSLLMG